MAFPWTADSSVVTADSGYYTADGGFAMPTPPVPDPAQFVNGGLRTYGRISNPDGTKTWEVISTTASGDNTLIMLATLCQCLLLGLGESPFYGSYGIPARKSVMQQVAPDYYMTVTQQQFAPFFASLTVSRVTGTGTPVNPTPAYTVSCITYSGVALGAQVAY